MCAADSQLIKVLERQCIRSDGNPKTAFKTFDEAFVLVAGAVGHGSNRTHVYRCPNGHGWHLAKNERKAPV